MTNQRDYYEDELNLRDILAIFSKYKRSILLTPLIFALIALLFSWLFIIPLYQASATIEIGQVNGKLIEDSPVAEQRMKDLSFISNVIQTHRDIFKYEKDISSEEAFLQKTLQVKRSKDATYLIFFELLGRSRDVALKKANAIFETLKTSHDKAFEINIGMLKQQIDLIDNHIKLLQRDKLSKNRDSSTLNSYNAVVDSLVLQDQVRQLRELQNQKMALQMSLNSAVTYNTRLLGAIWVSKEPVTPNYHMIGLIAFVVGLFLGILTAFLRHSLSEQ